MHGEPAKVNGLSNDASRNGLEFAQRLLAVPTIPNPTELLTELAAAFDADGAGVAALSGRPLVRCSSAAPPSRWPWEADPALAMSLRGERSSRSLPHPEGGALLATATPSLGQTPWLIWLESRRRTIWNSSEAAAFTLAATAIARALDAGAPRWTEQLERLMQVQHLEQAAVAIHRVAHDYGNVLTTILGFSELALGQQIPAGSALNRYLSEVRSGAENGARLTNQLRLFSGRQPISSRPCPLDLILAEEQRRVVAEAGNASVVEVALPPELPPVAIDGDHLRIIVAALLDNAVEAAGYSGTVTITARAVTIAAEECLDYFGDVQAGPNVEITITDSGSGLSQDVCRRLFVEPFFSTKPRRRGYGLFTVYGVLRCCKGGLRLGNDPTGGAAARVVLPVALVPAPAVSPSNLGRSTGEKILVAAGDSLLLRAVAKMLEKAGHCVQTAADAEQALAAQAAGGGPFRLVVADEALPRGSGVELARRLLKHDAEVRVLFMTDRPNGQEVPRELAGCVGEMLQKPFRPEELLRAVRTALDGGSAQTAQPAQRTANDGSAAQEVVVSSSH